MKLYHFIEILLLNAMLSLDMLSIEYRKKKRTDVEGMRNLFFLYFIEKMNEERSAALQLMHKYMEG